MPDAVPVAIGPEHVVFRSFYLLRRAEAQGVKPFASLEDFAGDPKLTADFDVDAFLRQVREDRDRPSRSVE